jgi:2-oxoglutarate dehydrogenase E2 component (dihydrolipoamide succinyltransferase)
MAVALKVPAVGESIKEVEIANWLKGVGDRIERDEPLVVVESDKATVEVPSPVSGKISELLKKKGDKAAVGELIAYIEEGAGTAGLVAAEPKKDAVPPNVTVKPAAEIQGAGHKGATRIMPAAQRALHEHGLSPEQVDATGPGGRLLKEDVLRRAEQEQKQETRPAAVKTPAASLSEDGRQQEVVRMSPMRRRIAERLVEAQSTAALLTTFNEIDMTAVMALRQKHKENFQQRYNIKLGFMSFFVKAAVDALKLVPQVNAQVSGEDIVYHNYFDIGVAVGGGKGLVVPILRNAERMSFAEIERGIADFARRAAENKIGLDELKGGTFTISNGGIYGSLLSTPIVNPPQSGILGLHAIQDRPIALNGQVVIRPMMYVALTYDHRIVDGREAVTFLKRIKDAVEDPSRMLMEV